MDESAASILWPWISESAWKATSHRLCQICPWLWRCSGRKSNRVVAALTTPPLWQETLSSLEPSDVRFDSEAFVALPPISNAYTEMAMSPPT
jgi:hypothetical protein